MSKNHCRKTFATETLSKITNRSQYYRRILNSSTISEKRRKRIQTKFDRDMKIRKLLNRAISHRYC